LKDLSTSHIDFDSEQSQPIKSVKALYNVEELHREINKVWNLS